MPRECEDAFYAMPKEIRGVGMWADTRRGDVVRRKPEYRLALARQNYVLIENAPLGGAGSPLKIRFYGRFRDRF